MLNPYGESRSGQVPRELACGQKMAIPSLSSLNHPCEYLHASI